MVHGRGRKAAEECASQDPGRRHQENRDDLFYPSNGYNPFGFQASIERLGTGLEPAPLFLNRGIHWRRTLAASRRKRNDRSLQEFRSSGVTGAQELQNTVRQGVRYVVSKASLP